MGKLFVTMYRVFSKQSKIFWVILILISMGLGYFALHLRFNEDITAIFPQSKSAKNMAFLLRHSGLNNKLFFNISFKDRLAKSNPSQLIALADVLSDSLSQQFIPAILKKIISRQNLTNMGEKYAQYLNLLPLYLEAKDYRTIDSLLTDSLLFQNLKADKKNLLTPMGFVSRDFIRKDPLHLTTLMLNRLKNWNSSGNVHLYDGHFLSKDGRHLLITAFLTKPGAMRLNQKAFSRIDALINRFQVRYPTLQITYFGGALVASGNAQRIKKDIILSVSIALLILIILLTWVFRKKSAFLILLLPVAFGALTAFAVLAIIKGEVSAISLGIGSVLLGISVDYSLHIFSHIRAGKKIEAVLKDLTDPILMSSTTTAIAFLSLNLVQSKMLNDLGLFAAVSVFTASLFSLIVLPLLLKNQSEKESPSYRSTLIDRIALVDLSRNRWVVLSIVIISLLFLIFNKPVHFSADMTAFNYMKPALKKSEKQLNRLTGNSTKNIYLLSHGSNLNAALCMREQTDSILGKLHKQYSFRNTSPSQFFLLSREKQQEAINRWNRFWKSRKKGVEKAMIFQGEKLGFKPESFAPFYQLLKKKQTTVSPDTLLKTDQEMLSGFVIHANGITALVDILQPKGSFQQAAAMAKILKNKTTSWVINRQMVTQELLGLLKRDVNKLAVFSMLFIFLFLLIAYGRIELALLTSLPVVLTWFWATGVMNLMGISFNIFNVIILTFIFGLGIDYSIFITRGLMQNHKYGHQKLSSYRISVLLSVLTTILGIGVLIVAKHPALRSIATMSIIGVLIVVLLSFVLQPLIFRWIVTNRGRPRIRPVTSLDFLFSIVSLLYFLFGALFLNLLIMLLFLIPVGKEKKKLFFHHFFRWIEWLLIYMNFLSKKTILNPSGEDFSKPAILLANHQSHADLMLIALLYPKIVILTNARNFNNPLYGLVLRYADYIPVAEGYKKAVSLIRNRVLNGYSILIFPEGHRSSDGNIRRFHKGAFYLAKELHLEVIPILIHGVGTLLSKEEFFLKRGNVTTLIYPRIDLSKGAFGTDLREQAKKMRAFFVKEHTGWRKRLETPDYYKVYLLGNYIYKGPVLEWYLRVKIKLEENYRFFNALIPEKCTLTDIGCGYGFLDFILALVSTERSITALDYDEEKIAVADNCVIRGENLRFYAVDVTEYSFENQDLFLLNDVLHYLPEREQMELLETCISHLNPGGKIIIRDADRDLEKRHKGTELTELFSTKSGFNKTKNRLFFLSHKTIEALAAKHAMRLEIIDKTKHTSNLVYLLQK